MNCEIEEITDLDAAWGEVEPLMAGLSEYTAALRGVRRVDGWRRRLRGSALSGPETLTVLARLDGKAVGLLTCGIAHKFLDYDETFAYVDSGFVVEGLRHGGLGRAMLEYAEAWCRERGIRQLRTTVDGTNELGQAAWHGLGFRPSSYNLTKWLEEKR
jgi:GNAT superfamily N-acetyltransferase